MGWCSKPKATQVPTPIYNDVQGTMGKLQGYLSQGYKQGLTDRNEAYGGAGDIAQNLLSYGKKQQELGGTIDPETQAEAVRSALGTTSQAGLTPGSAGSRSIVARDLGLKSMDLERQRQGTAGDILGMEEFRPKSFGNELAQSFLGLTTDNTGMANQWINNQLAANEAVKGQDSFLGSLAKYSVKRGVDTAFDTAGAAAKAGASSGGM